MTKIIRIDPIDDVENIVDLQILHRNMRAPGLVPTEALADIEDESRLEEKRARVAYSFEGSRFRSIGSESLKKKGKVK